MNNKKQSTLEPNQDIVDLIFEQDKWYKHCQYCGTIYNEAWDTRLYKNDGPLDGSVFGKYNISTGVGPCCTETYNQELQSIENLIPSDQYPIY